MKNKIVYVGLVLGVIFLLLIGCSPAVSPTHEYEQAAATQAPDIAQPEAEANVQGPQEQPAAEVPTNQTVAYQPSGSDSLTAGARSSRMILKNAEVSLQVQNTDTAIDLVTQIVGDSGGYIISSRVWFETKKRVDSKFSTITIGIPVGEFERTMRRLRGIAMKVLDENATGEDVTDKYVDLQSQLTNLGATRDRIRSFLDQATTVEEALRVNKELSEIESQMEGIQGQMNYLVDRSAFSTITITIEPFVEDPPTATPKPTATPRPTRTPQVWRPSDTFDSAAQSLKTSYQLLVDMAIWTTVLFVPIVAPFFLIGWLLWRFLFRRSTKKNRKSEVPNDN